MEKFFKLKQNGTNVKTEIMAGIATFMTMAYILSVNPIILAGDDPGLWNAVFMATAISSFLGTFIMAVYANKPFALAPGMGLNAFFASVVAGIAAAQSISYQEAYAGGLAIVLFSGVLFTVLTIIKVREKIVEAIPKTVRVGIPAGIGLMIAEIGLDANCQIYTESGAHTMLNFFIDGPSTTLAKMGDAYPQMVLCVLTMVIGLFTIAILSHKNVKGAILYGIITGSVFNWVGTFVLGGNPFASLATASFVPPFADMFKYTFLKLNFGTLFNMGWVTLIMTVVSFAMVDMFDTIGTLIGTATRAGMVDEDGNMPGLNKAMISDSIATMAGACLGTPTVTTFVESATGVEEGGRTGLTALTVALLFLSCIFLAPVVALIPAAATSAALIYVGVLMLSAVKGVDFNDVSQSVPITLMLLIMPLTGHIGDGIGVGLIAYSIIKTFTGKAKDVSALTWVLSVLFIIKLFMPY